MAEIQIDGNLISCSSGLKPIRPTDSIQEKHGVTNTRRDEQRKPGGKDPDVPLLWILSSWISQRRRIQLRLFSSEVTERRLESFHLHSFEENPPLNEAEPAGLLARQRHGVSREFTFLNTDGSHQDEQRPIRGDLP